MMSNEINEMNLEEFNSLTEEEKKIALGILKQYAQDGKSELLDQLKQVDWEEIPVDIHTFLHEKKYLGNALYDGEGRFTLFPYWEEKLKEVFPTNTTTAYNNIVLTGAIGIGKSTFAVVCQLYLLYRLLCLKDPYQYYGMQPIDKITISFMNINLENAKGVALDKLNQMILASEWFLSHGEMRGVTNLVYHPGKHIELVAASSNNQIIGRALFCNFSDEINFMGVSNIERAKKKMIKLITQVDARMRSRFLRGTYLPTLNILASSKDSEQSFLEDYIKEKEENDSKTTLIVDEPQWVVDSRKDSKEKFYVAIGDKLLPNELLPLNPSLTLLSEYEGKGYKLRKVPIGYLEVFRQNLDEAICSIIGIATASTLKYFAGQKLVQAKTDTYRNPFNFDVIKVGNAKDDFSQYYHYFDLSTVDPDDMEKPLFIHIDHSLSNDKTGIAGVWIIGKDAALPAPDEAQASFSNEALDNLNSSINKDLHFKVAFSVSVEAPKGAQVSFSKTRAFIRWLTEKGFNIKGISMDTFQSANLKQDLISDGYNVTIQSVDRVQTEPGTSRKICLPYYFLRTILYECRIKLYKKCELLTEELLSLERKSDGHIDHPPKGSKDQADAVCGAAWLASHFSEEFAYEYGETLDLNVNINKANKNTLRKEEYIENFELELLNGQYIDPNSSKFREITRRNAKSEEDQVYLDIQDGFIII